MVDSLWPISGPYATGAGPLASDVLKFTDKFLFPLPKWHHSNILPLSSKNSEASMPSSWCIWYLLCCSYSWRKHCLFQRNARHPWAWSPWRSQMMTSRPAPPSTAAMSALSSAGELLNYTTVPPTLLWFQCLESPRQWRIQDLIWEWGCVPGGLGAMEYPPMLRGS